jgi:hypothetical protein
MPYPASVVGFPVITLQGTFEANPVAVPSLIMLAPELMVIDAPEGTTKLSVSALLLRFLRTVFV